MKYRIFIVVALFLLQCSMKGDKNLKYVALGDSYTICEGTTADQSWPVLLTKHLNDQGVNVELAANPARTGWTTKDLIDSELTVCEKVKPDFVTLMIGVNDWVQGVSKETFHKNLNYIINKVEATLTNKNNLVLITIPDFGVTPTGAMYGRGRDIAEGIGEFNDVIKEEADKRKLKCVDVFAESQKMKDNQDLMASDGLHPSAKEYAIWETLIYPVISGMLK